MAATCLKAIPQCGSMAPFPEQSRQVESATWTKLSRRARTPTVLIHPLTDHRRILPVEKRGELLEAADGFLLILSYNPGIRARSRTLSTARASVSFLSSSTTRHVTSKPKSSNTNPVAPTTTRHSSRCLAKRSVTCVSTAWRGRKHSAAHLLLASSCRRASRTAAPARSPSTGRLLTTMPCSGASRRLSPPSSSKDSQTQWRISRKSHRILWFDGRAKEAAEYYTSIFEGLRGHKRDKLQVGPGAGASIISFELAGQGLTAQDGGPMFQFSPAISFVVNCGNSG